MLSPIGYLRVDVILEIRFGVTGLELRSVDSDSSELVRWTLEAYGRHHTQIYGPVHGATTHKNSTTMSLYGYGQV
jgi:hypothetical protein